MQEIADRDNTDQAKAQAHLMAVAMEKPRFASQAVIRRVDLSYRLGDKIAGIVGRNASFAASRPAPFTPMTYPIVVGVNRSFAGDISTNLTLDDFRSESDPGAIASLGYEEPGGEAD
jgi:hypothetical protein